MHCSSTVLRSSRSSFLILALTLVAVSCSGTGGGCLTPFPAGARYQGPKSDNAINIRFSPDGINYFNQKWQTLIAGFAPGGKLELPVGCMKQDIPVIGEVIIADQGIAGCRSESCGQMDGKCETQPPQAGHQDKRDAPAKIEVTLTGFSMTPRAPDTLEVVLQMAIDTKDIFVDTSDRSHGSCLWLDPVKCSITFNSASASPRDNRLRATVKFSIDSKFDKLLAFSFSGVSGTEICGASGAAGKPQCLDADDLTFDGRNGCGNVYCGVADWDPLKRMMLQLISSALQDEVKKAIANQPCWSCTSNADCPRTTDGTNTASTCDRDNNVCMLGSKCVPRFTGMEGKLQMGALLGSFGAPANAEIELSVAAGATVVVDRGMSFGTRAGLQPSALDSCVPPQAAPLQAMVSFPDFDGEATPNSGYHMGFSISSSFLNQALWSAHQAGALCLNLTSERVGLIDTGLFKGFLPSLGRLTTRDRKDAPMMVVLRPARAPTMEVGEGSFDPMTHKPLKPLLTLTMPDVSVDFYALIDDRYARLFTLTFDMSMPLWLVFEGCDKVSPALGDVKTLITNIRAGNSEILAEDPQAFADLVPLVLSQAEPALAGGLGSFRLPPLGSFKMKVNEVKGLGRIPNTDSFNHLGLYATFLGAQDMCAVSAPRLQAALKASRMPRREEMRLTGRQALPWPEAVLEVHTTGSTGSPEFSFKVDEGLWSTFRQAADHQLTVTHPAFLLQGRHIIHVRARMAEAPHGISSSAEVGFWVDWEPPEVSLVAEPSTDRLLAHARDVISADRLLYAYQVGEGEVSPFGPAREISLSAVDQQGGVSVLVRDEFGNVGQATYRPPQIDIRRELSAGLPIEPSPVGCSAVGGLELLALAGLWLIRRKRRSA